MRDELIYDLRTKFIVHFARAPLRNLGLTIVTFCAFVLGFSAQALGTSDLNVGGIVRHYPLSGVLDAEAGYGILLRGEANDPFSSYLRARIYGSTAAVYNSLDAAVEFFPLAILGVRAGGEAIQNSKDYSAHDCNRFKCEGRFYRTYIDSQVTLGAGPVFVQGRWKRERWTQKNANDGDFIDPTSAVAIKSQGDSQTVYMGVAGYKVDENWTVLGIVRYSENDQQGGYSRFPYGVVRYKQGPYSIGLGGGVFESHIKEKGFAAVGTIRWEISPSLAVR